MNRLTIEGHALLQLLEASRLATGTIQLGIDQVQPVQHGPDMNLEAAVTWPFQDPSTTGQSLPVYQSISPGSSPMAFNLIDSLVRNFDTGGTTELEMTQPGSAGHTLS